MKLTAKNAKEIREKVKRSGWGIYDARKYRYMINPETDKLVRVSLDCLDTTAILFPEAWEEVE